MDVGLCDLPCPTYSNGTRMFCGGTERAYAVYEMYAFVHQTADGCYDPWRFIWYQVRPAELPRGVRRIRNWSENVYC